MTLKRPRNPESRRLNLLLAAISVIAGLFVLLVFARMPGCEVDEILLKNEAGHSARITVRTNDSVLWNGALADGESVYARYRVSDAAYVYVEVSVGSDRQFRSQPDYIAPRMLSNGAVFTIAHGVVSRANRPGDHSTWFAVERGILACIVQSTVDLTGA